MLRRLTLGAIAVGLAVSAAAQDSVSKHGTGLPGDALTPWNTSQQCAAYVVDLVPFQTSWGHTFAIAPLVKSPKAASTFFNNLHSAQSISRRQAQSVPFAASAYQLWEGAPGYGINASDNLVPNTTAPTGSANQFALAFADFGRTASNVDYNGVTGAIVNYLPTDPTRLYVRRVNAVVNGFDPAENRSQLGIGTIDEFGTLMFRGDAGSPAATGPNALTGNNVFRVDLPARSCGALNVLDNDGLTDTAATRWLVVKSATVHNTPNIGPASVFGDAYYLGANYDRNYVYGATQATVLQTDAHRPGTDDHRGTMAYTTKNVPCIAGTHGTGAFLTKSIGSSPTNSISVFGLNSDGSPAGTLLLTPPANVVDPTTGRSIFQDSGNGFGNYRGSLAFRGGNSPVGVNVDQAGRLLAAAVLYTPEFATNPLNYLLVARVGTGCNVEWTLAAYAGDETGQVQSGKPILGPGGVQIGQLVQMLEVTGGAPLGPSFSGPAIDAAGNIWFVSSVLLTHWRDGTPRLFPDYDSALIRAVYNPANFSYDLELVLELGDTFVGANSGVPWRITFMGVASGSSADPATVWSQNISEQAHLGQPVDPTWSPADPRTLGGLVLRMKVVYDVNGDGEFNDPTASGGDPNSPDEAYQVVAYIGADVQGGPSYVCADTNCDGVVDTADIDNFVYVVVNGQPAPGCPTSLQAADTNGDGVVDTADIDSFVAAVVGGGCQ